MHYVVIWKDGSMTDNLSYGESASLIESRPNDWSAVRTSEYGKDCSEENAKLKERIKEAFKNGFSTT